VRPPRRRRVRRISASSAVGAGERPLGPSDHRRPADLHRAGRHPPRRRQGRDERAGPVRIGLRHVHPAPNGGGDGDRGVPRAVCPRAERARDRGHLPVRVRQLLLAERPRPQQRPLRSGHGALGHQGQAGRDAALSAFRRPLPHLGRPLRPRRRRRRRRGRGERPPLPGAGLPPRPGPDCRPRLLHVRRPDRAHQGGTVPAAPRSGPRALERSRLLPPRSEALRAPPRRPRRRDRAPPRCPRARPADPGDRPRQGVGAVPPLLSGGPVRPGGRRLLPAPPPAERHPDRDGRALRQPGRVRPPDQGPPDRLRPRPHLRHRRPHPRPEARRLLRVLRRPHRLARPRGRLPGRPRRQPPPRPVDPQLRDPGAARLPGAHPRGLPRLPRAARRRALGERPPRSGRRPRRGGRRAVPLPGSPAERRVAAGTADRRDGDPAV
ncbi:MAG: Starvation sensing protein RspA, partial [uncultured Thermomicrobiales bacterium]